MGGVRTFGKLPWMALDVECMIFKSNISHKCVLIMYAMSIYYSIQIAAKLSFAFLSLFGTKRIRINFFLLSERGAPK